MKYLKQFQTHSQYEAYTADTSNFITPNVSICVQENEVHYSPFIETRVVAKYNVTSTTDPTMIASVTTGLSKIEIDGVEQPSVTTGYTFSTTGEHIVKYTFKIKTVIDGETFKGCSDLTSITIPNSVISIGTYAFSNCIGLTSCTIGSGVTYIGERTFSGCTSLTSIDIPDGVTRIGDFTFSNCISLTSCTIGSGVTSISQKIFVDCSGLTSITSNAMTAPIIGYQTFWMVGYNGTLTVPIGSSGYDVWMGTGDYYLGKYNWTKVEQ